MIEKEESSFSDLFSKLGIKGSGVPEPTSKKPCEPELKSVVLAYEKRSGNKVVTTIRDVPEPIRQKHCKSSKKPWAPAGLLSTIYLSFKVTAERISSGY